MFSVRRPAFLTLVLSALFAAPALAADDPAIKLQKDEKIVFLGDSITQLGAGPKGYITLVKNAMAKNHKDLDVQIVNAGISGNKVPDLEKRLKKDVLDKKPTLVVIYIGINDVWHGEDEPAKGTTKDKFEAGLLEIIGKIKDS